MVKLIASENRTLFALAFVIGQTSWFVGNTLSVRIEEVVVFAFNTTVSVSYFAFGDIIDSLLGSDFVLKANTVEQLEGKFAILRLCDIVSAFFACAQSVILFTAQNDPDTLVINQNESFSAGFAVRSVLDDASILSISFAFVIIKIKPRRAFCAKAINVPLCTTLSVIEFIIFSAGSIDIFIVAKFANIAFIIETICSTAFDKIEWNAFVVDPDLAEVTI